VAGLSFMNRAIVWRTSNSRALGRTARSPSVADVNQRIGVRSRPYRSWSFAGWTPLRQRPGTVETASRNASKAGSRVWERNRVARPGPRVDGAGPRTRSVTAGISRKWNRISEMEAPIATASM